MKYFFLLYLSFYSFVCHAQDTIKPVEKDQETSFDNYKLLIIALVGFAILMIIRFWFKRKQKQ